MKIYFITRFSVYDPNFKGFRISTYYDEQEYERRLFAADRLENKFDTFQNITFPSVVGQSLGEWEWVIYISDRMPKEYRIRLHAIVGGYPNISVIDVKDFGEFFERVKSYNYGQSFATVRLDDDDGLDNCYVQKLQQYSTNVGSIVSYTEVVRVTYKNGHVAMGDKFSGKNIALGLAGIGFNIYDCGRHSDIDARYNVIYDNTPNMLLLNCSPFADTKRGFTKLNRVVAKFKRVLFLLITRPTEVPREIVAPIRKILRSSCGMPGNLRR
jgi:hypothetical protein